MTRQLEGFSTDAFEQFVRALTLCVFGPGVTAFGNGKDGGREATFRGSVPYPFPPTEQWSGYGVIQAKCKEKTETTEKDQAWALKQLSEELKLFKAKRATKPEYYVFVTNIELSSATDGGRDQADDLIKSYYDSLPLKGHAVWDANQIITFLDRYNELRRRFKAYLTPGDVLDVLLAEYEERRTDISRTLTTFLEREVKAEEFARLEQTGNRADDQLRLAQLFFDLPASEEPALERPYEEIDDNGRLPDGILYELLREGSQQLDPKTVYDHNATPDNNTSQLASRFVLLGGPGSGKSTIGQFMAQIHRSALLTRRERHLVAPDTVRIATEIQRLCDEQNLPWPSTPRYPFRIELNRFAKQLASQESDHVETLSAYLLKGIDRNNVLQHKDLIKWFGTCPILLILDGLDEVPATSNREAVLAAIDDLLSEARQVNSDTFVVATTRLQGYRGELSSGPVALRYILPLSTPRALRYIETYANVKFARHDPNKVKDIMSTIRESSRRELTAQLMTTPLQATFMATVVSAQGDPGEDRWELFDSYYRIIYDRERQKAVPPYDAVFSKHRAIIDRLHHDIGFMLQRQGETAANTASGFPIVMFEHLVNQYLTESGWEQGQKSTLVQLITDAARYRLLLLTSRIQGELSFDVRSLQEYMAAECLLTGETEVVKRRLAAVAFAPYWRNVLLFAVSKCYADTRLRHFQEYVRTICEDLNASSDNLLAATMAGSELAADIMQSGAAAQNMLHASHLLRVAMRLLGHPYISDEHGDISIYRRLVVVYRDALASVYKEELNLRIGHSVTTKTLGAWPLLIALIERGVVWANDLAARYWPAEVKDAVPILELLVAHVPHSTWFRAKLASHIWRIPPSKASNLLNTFDEQVGRPEKDIIDSIAILRKITIRSGFDGLRIPIKIDPALETITSLTISPVSGLSQPDLHSAWEFIASIRDFHPGWLPIILASGFATSANITSLEQTLHEFASKWDFADISSLRYLPWPLAACLQNVHTAAELESVAQRVAAGLLGNTPDWIEIESRWHSEGISLEQLTDLPEQLLEGDISHMVVASSWSLLHRELAEPFLDAICSAAERAKRSDVRQMLVWFLMIAASFNKGLADCIKPSRLRNLLDQNIKYDWSMSYVGFPNDPMNIEEWISFFEWLGRSKPDCLWYRDEELDADDSNGLAWLQVLEESLLARSATTGRDTKKNAQGLLRVLSQLVSLGQVVDRLPKQVLEIDDLTDIYTTMAVVLIRLAQNLQPGEEYELVDATMAVLQSEAKSTALKVITRTANAHAGRNPAVERFILALRTRLGESDYRGVPECDIILRRQVRSKPTTLQQSDTIKALALPLLPVND